MLLYSQEYSQGFMSLSRRKFILIAGSSAVIIAAGKATIDLDKMPSTAVAAWSEAQTSLQDLLRT